MLIDPRILLKCCFFHSIFTHRWFRPDSNKKLQELGTGLGVFEKLYEITDIRFFDVPGSQQLENQNKWRSA